VQIEAKLAHVHKMAQKTMSGAAISWRSRFASPGARASRIMMDGQPNRIDPTNGAADHELSAILRPHAYRLHHSELGQIPESATSHRLAARA